MSKPIYLHGKHAVLAALKNKNRTCKRLLLTVAAQKELDGALPKKTFSVEVVDGKKLDQLLPVGTIHQGIVLEALPLDQPSLDEWLIEESGKTVIILDQVSDPHNVGAILRSAAAFDVGAVICTDRNAPAETGVMAKSASGALDMVPIIAVTNLVQAMEQLKKAGYWTYGLDSAAKESIAQVKFDAKTALVLGAEGHGLRRLTAEHCDFLIKLPMSDRMESLNVSNAAAIALYDIYRRG